MAGEKPPKSTRPPYVDRPEITEIFADSLHQLYYDGVTARLEFAVHRPEPTEGDTPHRRWAYTACRVVLPLPGLLDLLNQAAQLQRRLAEQQNRSPMTHKL